MSFDINTNSDNSPSDYPTDFSSSAVSTNSKEKEKLFLRLMNIGLRALGRRRLTEHQLRDRLMKKISQKWYVDLIKPFSAEQIRGEIDRVITRLRELGHLNDTDFAELFIRDTMQYRPHGSMWITMQLSKKGISKDTVASAYEKIREEERSEDCDKDSNGEYGRNEGRRDNSEVIGARTIAEKKIPSLARYEPSKQYEKLFRFICSRGFSASIAFKVLDELGMRRGQTRSVDADS